MDYIAQALQATAEYGTSLLENIKLGATYFLTFKNVLAVFGGVSIGTFCGALPGLSITMAVTLTLPFAFTLDPLTAISLLLAVYVGAIYGGSISAILLNTPGTPAAAATSIDGFQLAQKGQAMKALQMANWSSCVGDIVSTAFVIALCPLLKNVAFYFGSTEYFALILFSVTIIGSVAGKSIVKGLIAGVLGFLLSTVGMDPVTGVERFSFGSLQLMKGISLIPLLIGMFAVPELLAQLNRSRLFKGRAKIAQTGIGENSNLTWAEFKNSFGHMVRGGFVGLGVGMVPGLGATPSAFLSYDWAKKVSKHPEEFGKGSLEGIAAAEAGNNAVNGATLVPLLTLGIPGDVVTAILLGAFMIFDLQPGPLLFIQHMDLVFGIFCALIMCDISLRIVGIFFIRYAQKITTVPTSLLFPSIMVLCVFGSYSANGNVTDVLVMMVFGFVSYVMSTYNMSPIPFVIAFILGPMLEKGVRRNLSISDGNLLIFFESPLAIVFYIFTILAIITIARRNYKNKRSNNPKEG